MTDTLGALIAASLLGAALMIAHAALLWLTIRSELPARWKWASLIPPVLPLAGWRAGRRAAVVIWVVFVALYGAVRAFWLPPG